MPFKLNFVSLFCYISKLEYFYKKKGKIVCERGAYIGSRDGSGRHAGPIGHADLGTSCFHVILGTGERKREKQAS
jgi:hypothetical protein